MSDKTPETTPAEPASYTDADSVMTGGIEPPEQTAVRANARGLWAAVISTLVVLVLLVVFILENGQNIKISFLGAHGHLPLGVALLLAAVIGGIAVVLAGLIRILQLRRRRATRRPHRRHR